VGSYAYWRFAEDLRDELAEIQGLARAAYIDLENGDDPGELAVALGPIKRRLENAAAQIGTAVQPLKKTAAALETVPEFKGL
jgi:hypothetical protein